VSAQPSTRDLAQAEAELEAKKAELAELARFPEMNPGPVLRLDGQGNVLLSNAAARELFGSDVLGRRWQELCPGLDTALFGRILGGERLIVEPHLGERWYCFVHVLDRPSGNVFTYGSDVTARSQSEQRLAEQAAKLAELARFPEMNPGPTLRTDLDGNVLICNAAARNAFGEIVGSCWLDLLPTLDSAGWGRVLAASDPVPFEAKVGDREFVFAHRRDPGGTLVFVYGADITAQKRAERALRQTEKMATLGTLAAGVAHELNNPAAATRRAAEHLLSAFEALEVAHRELDTLPGSPPASLLAELAASAREKSRHPSELDGLARSDAEARVEEWLDRAGVDGGWELAPALTGQGLDGAALDRVVREVGASSLGAVVRWLAAAFRVYALLYEIGQGSRRVSEIVRALKSYSYLGQAPVQAIDIHEGIDDTLVILRNKLKVGIDVQRDYGKDVPRIMAWGSELNQVWTNLIDNAADAMGGSGRLILRTRLAGERVSVEVEDDGPGIPEAVRSRVFDPFFTTKEPGKGTGLGLATTHSIVTERHHGTIALTSVPGRTVFRVELPLAPPAEQAG
jgi:signal transduction histidine kinase